MGIPAIFILTSWFFKYAYILFDHTVWGYDEPPTLDIQMLNPLNEQRPLAQVVILGLIYAAVKFTGSTWGAAPAVILAALAAFVFPASVAVLDVVRQRLDQDPSFRPKYAATTLRLAELAAQGGGLPRIARSLVADFDARFPGDPGVVAARALAERLGR